MQIVYLLDFGSGAPQVLGAGPCWTVVGVDSEFIISIEANCGGRLGGIESRRLRLGASDEGRGGEVLRHDKFGYEGRGRFEC